jgi:hypothetical protein
MTMAVQTTAAAPTISAAMINGFFMAPPFLFAQLPTNDRSEPFCWSNYFSVSVCCGRIFSHV